jgi:hypothetical protein
MDEYIELDRQTDLLASLEELLLHVRAPLQSASACKWALVAAHSMLQGACCIALRGTAGFETWKPQHAKKWLEAYEQGKELPDPQLDYFVELFDKLFGDDPKIDRDWIKWLNETRNGLVHFNTDSYAIKRASVVRAIREALKATRKTPELSRGIFFYVEEHSERFHSLCDAINAQMELHADAE